jgi:hypothetical protein
MPSPPDDLKKLTEAFIRFSVRIDGQVATILQCVERLETRFGEIERVNAEHRRQIGDNAHAITDLREDLGRVCSLDDRVRQMEPWVAGLRWALTIAGGSLVLAVVGVLLWAFAQSGVGIP